jgi:hypothetical protein
MRKFRGYSGTSPLKPVPERVINATKNREKLYSVDLCHLYSVHSRLLQQQSSPMWNVETSPIGAFLILIGGLLTDG